VQDQRMQADRVRTLETLAALLPCCLTLLASVLAWRSGPAWFGPTEQTLSVIAVLGTAAGAAAIVRDDVRLRVLVSCVLLLGAPALRLGELLGHEDIADEVKRPVPLGRGQDDPATAPDQVERGEDRLGEWKDVLHHARDLAREAGARSIGQAEGQLLRVAWQPIQLDPVSLRQSGEDLRRREAHGVPGAGEPCRQGYERFNVAPRTVRDQNNAFGSHLLPPTHRPDAAPAVSLLRSESPVANTRVCSDDECGQTAPCPLECLQTP